MQDVPQPHHTITDIPFIDVGGHSDIGKNQEENTDFYFTADLNRSLLIGPSSLKVANGIPWTAGTVGKLLMVADGGMCEGMGRVASWAAVDEMARHVATMMPWIEDEKTERVHRAIEQGWARSQARVRAEAKTYGFEDRQVGTTLTMAYISWPHLYVSHAGDSRAYLYRDGSLRQLTTDTRGTASSASGDINGANGDGEERSLQTPSFEPIMTNLVSADDEAVEVQECYLDLRLGDRVLLCTDGLIRHLGEDELRAHMDKATCAAMACTRLIDAANAAGGEDNITAVVAHIRETDSDTESDVSGVS